MSLKLSGPGIQPLGATAAAGPFVGRIIEQTSTAEDRNREILRVKLPTERIPAGFRAYLFDSCPERDPPEPSFLLSREWHYLSEGDVVRLDPMRRRIAVLYRRKSPSNSFLLTERCDNFCVMCS